MSHYTMLSKYGNCRRLLKIKTSWKSVGFLQIKSGRIFDIFNKTIIPLAFVGYGMIIANSALVTRLVGYLTRILYPTRTRGIIVKYVLHLDLYVTRFFFTFFRSKNFILKMKQMMLFNYM